MGEKLFSTSFARSLSDLSFKTIWPQWLVMSLQGVQLWTLRVDSVQRLFASLQSCQFICGCWHVCCGHPGESQWISVFAYALWQWKDSKENQYLRIPGSLCRDFVRARCQEAEGGLCTTFWGLSYSMTCSMSSNSVESISWQVKFKWQWIIGGTRTWDNWRSTKTRWNTVIKLKWGQWMTNPNSVCWCVTGFRDGPEFVVLW